jgi:hypothetical protein
MIAWVLLKREALASANNKDVSGLVLSLSHRVLLYHVHGPRYDPQHNSNNNKELPNILS